MKIIQKLQGHRWFIWTIVFIVASLGGLAVYVYNTAENDNSLVEGVIVSKPHNITGELSEAQAIKIVSNLPEVKDYINRVKLAHGDPHIRSVEIYGDKPYWTINVYESLTDHDVTFGWYEVDKKTGKVKKDETGDLTDGQDLKVNDPTVIYRNFQIQAEGMTLTELKKEILEGTAILLKKNNIKTSLKLSAFILQFESINSNDPDVTKANDSLVNKYGPCWGVSEGECRE